MTKEIESEVRKLYDESDGLTRRVSNTEERLKTVENQFIQDQESITEVNTHSNNIDSIIFQFDILTIEKINDLQIPLFTLKMILGKDENR